MKPRFKIGEKVYNEIGDKFGIVTNILERDSYFLEKFHYEIEYNGFFKKYKEITTSIPLNKLKSQDK